MLTSSQNGQANPDERGNKMEDSPVMTIEYLRARLLSERLVSKAAKDRVEELAKQVEQLEEQLEIVTSQRKRAEKATLDILSFLASQGISDISEYETKSDEEGSLCESNEGKCDANDEADNVGSLKLKGNHNGSCSDRSTSSGRALSWNGRKETARLSDKKHFDSSIKRQTRFPLVGSTQRIRPGKSCRKIKRREMRAMVESRLEYASDAQDNKTLESSENHANGVRLSLTLQEKESNAGSPPIPNHKYSGDMERALEHQAQLIGCYEAQEKAQRDWEEKYGDNHISTLDSCEPENHSDVTEERDDNKESVSHPTDQVFARHGHEVKSGVESEPRGKEKSSAPCVNKIKFTTANVDADNLIDMQGSRSESQPCDFSFSAGNTRIGSLSQTQEHVETPSFHFSAQSCSHFAGSANEEEPQSQRVGMILGALQEAKLLIKEKMGQFPETSVSKMRDSDLLKVPVGCSGLFRVPTNSQPGFPTEDRLLDSGYSSELTHNSLHSRPLGSFPRFPDPPSMSFDQISYRL